MFCGFAIRSREIVICYGLGGLQIPWFDRSNLFLRRISNPSGRLAGYGAPSGVWNCCKSVGTDVAYHTVFPHFILLKRSFSSLYAVFRDKNAIFAV